MPTTAEQQSKRAIVVGIDESEASDKTFQWACDNVLRPGDDVHFFHVLALPTPLYLPEADLYGAAEVDPLVIRAQVSQAAKHIHEKFVPRLPAGTSHQVEVVPSEGDADTVGKLLCQRADQLQAAAIVVGSEHKGALSRFIMGSVSLYCTKMCVRPVVIVP